MAARYALIGNPVGHSLSPIIHRQFARETRQEIDFELIEAPLGGFAESARQFIQDGGLGFNVTLPFKREACQLADYASERAQAAGAANTIVVEREKRLYADNTDGVGLLADLDEHNCAIEGMDLLVLGAGGAVRGLLQPLRSREPRRLVIANRSADKAKELAADYPNCSIEVAALPDGLENTQWSAVINATSASLYRQLPELPARMSISLWAYDLVYMRQATPFMRWAKKHGAKTILDGTGMLVAQAAESFRLWRGLRPPLEPALRAVRKKIRG